MTKKLIDFIKKSLKIGRSKEEIIKSLIDVGWDKKNIENGFESLTKPLFFKKYKRPIVISIGFIFIAILIVAGWQIFFKKPTMPARFTLEASLTDAAGTDSATIFILKSTQPLSKRTINKILKFTPEIEFKVKKITQKSSILASVFAQTEESAELLTVFEIEPSELLVENEVYQVTIIDSDYADREYSWAFQTKAAFQVVQTHPRNQGTSVPINSGIEITFNRENLIKPEKYFSIEPKVDGTFEQYAGTLVFLPNKLEEMTVYTITIKKGLESQGSDDLLSEDYVFAFETGEHEYTGQKPSFDFRNDFLEFVPDKKTTIEVSYYALDPSSLEIGVYKFSDIDEFFNSYQNSRQWQLSWTSYYWNRAGSSYRPNENQKVLSFNPIIIEAGYQKFIEIPQILEKGYYLLDVNVGGKHNQEWLQITPLSHYFSVSYDRSILWMYDFQKKEPITGSKVYFYDKSADTSSLGTTDKDGLIEFFTPDALKEKNEDFVAPRFFKVEHNAYLPVLIKADTQHYYWGGYYQAVGKGDLYWDYLSTDRYTYQMNDTLRYWGVVKGRQEDLKQKKIKVGIYEGYYWFGYGPWSDSSVEDRQPLAFQEALVSQFDTIQGELSFKGISPGYYSVMVTIGDEVISMTSIEVLTYSKPVYQITVTSSKNVVFAGENVVFDVKANFFDGTPVSNLKLKYNGYWHSLQPINGELILDANGEGGLSITPNYYEDKYFNYPRNLSITFSPKLSEEGEIWGKSQILVFGPNIYSQAFQEEQLDDTYKFTTKLNHIVINNQVPNDPSYYWYWRNEYIGNPVENYPVSAEVIKITHYKIESGQYYDYINKIVRKSYYYGTKEETIEELTGTTNSDGEWSFTKTLPKEEGVVYRVIFSGKDSGGRKFESYSYARYSSYAEWKDFAVSLNINGESYSKEFSFGEEIKLDLRVLEGEKPVNAKVLFYRSQNSIDRVSIESKFSFEEKFEKKFMPSVQYWAVVLGPYGFEQSNSVIASFKEGDNNLTIDIEPEKEKYRPQEEVRINLTVKDKDSKPVSAEVNIAVVDEALFHILPYNWQKKILEGLYQNIYGWFITGGSQYAFLKESGAESGGCFGKGTPVLMKDGSFKPIEKIKVGDQILTFEDENNSVLAPAIVQGISQHSVDEYLVINNSLEVTPEHKMFVNREWHYAGNIKIGDILIGINGFPQKVYSIEKKQVPKTIVYNIVVNKYHTYFAGGYFVHNVEKGGMPRANFVDVAMYQTVHTDNNGKASVEFTTPDNITAWRTTAIAFSPDDLKAGQGIKLIKTSLPFFVDATLSNYYLVGDSPILRLRVFGDNYKQNKLTKLSVNSESLNLDKEESLEDSAAYLSLGQLLEGEHELVISAKQEKSEDSILRKIKVVKSYFRKAESSLYELSENLSNIEKNEDGFTKLVFMDAIKGRLYGTLWHHMFLDGIRSDQITVNYFGEKLLTQYFNEPEPSELLDLSNYHTPGGGIGLFPYSDSDLELSAKITDLAPEFVFQSELKKYFRNALQDKKSDIHRISKALYGLASLKDPVLVKINLIKENKELTLEDKIYISLALAKLGDKENARRIYEQDIKNQLRFQGQEAWLGQEEDITRRVKLTSTIAVLSSYLNLEPDKVYLWNYMSTHNPEKDLNVLEEALFMKSELAILQENYKAEFSYETNKRSDSVTLEKGNIYTVILPPEEINTIKFSSIKGEINLASFYERSRDPEELVKNEELGLTREYFVNNNSTNSFNEGDIVLVRLDPKIAVSAIDGSYQVVDYLPSGLKPVTRFYEPGLSYGTICDPVWYPAKIVNNIVYFNISKRFNETMYCNNRTLNYYARVISTGFYKANPALIQSMKDLESLNISTEDSVEIK